ncbi:MAG: DeoR family transcriptional regulator [Hydrogenobacter sp.]
MDRKEKLLELIKEGYNNVKALSQYFGVSLMTIYRDVRELEKEGKLIRKHGEIKLRTPEDTKEEGKDTCAYCTKLLDKRLEFIYYLKDRKIKACCAHCGLLLYKQI